LIEKIHEQQRTGEFTERRAYKPFWRSRIRSTQSWNLGGEAVFLCGPNAYRADIRRITLDTVPMGVSDVVEGDVCYAIRCKFQPRELIRAMSQFLGCRFTYQGRELFMPDY